MRSSARDSLSEIINDITLTRSLRNMEQITVRSPATVSNVVCGFDCLGFALEEPFDEITVRKVSERGITIVNLDDSALPTDPAKNVAGVAVQALADEAGVEHGFEIAIRKGIRPGSGIGSSSASSCGAVAAANELIDRRFVKAELVKFAMEGELLASGSRHADNAAPCTYGGFTLVRSADPLDVVELEFPALWACVIHPQIEIKTSDARAILPREVPLADAVRNWSNLGAFVAGLMSGDLDLIARSMEDVVIEPVRQRLIPKFAELKAAGLEAGAMGGGISGSGPSVFMLCDAAETANEVAGAMRDVYKTTDIEFDIYTSQVGRQGVRII